MKFLGLVLVSALVSSTLARPSVDTTSDSEVNYEELRKVVDELIESEYKEDAFQDLEPVFKIVEEGLDHLGDVDDAMLEYCANKTGLTDDDNSVDFDNLSEPMMCTFTCVAELKGYWKEGHVSGALGLLKSLAWLVNTKYPEVDPVATKWARQSHSCLNIVDEVGCEGFVSVFKCIRDIEMQDFKLQFVNQV